MFCHPPPNTVIAATSTEAHIIKHLDINDPVVICGPVTRNNITPNVIPISDELGGIKDADTYRWQLIRRFFGEEKREKVQKAL